MEVFESEGQGSLSWNVTSLNLRLWRSEWVSQERQWERLQVEGKLREGLRNARACRSIWEPEGRTLKGNLTIKAGVTYEIRLVKKAGLGRAWVLKAHEQIYVGPRKSFPSPKLQWEAMRGFQAGRDVIQFAQDLRAKNSKSWNQSPANLIWEPQSTF